jgi:4a-hydroxytetrahydrobiopterin dehydratase
LQLAKLTEEEVGEKLKLTAGWSLQDLKWIVKKYRFAGFLDGIAFVQEVGRIAELELDHHPMIAIDYKMVTLRLTSWNAGGLTELDFEAARRFDAAAAAQAR